MALQMLEGAAGALRSKSDETEQDEDKVKRTLIGPEIKGVRKILPENMPMGPLPRTETFLGGAG